MIDSNYIEFLHRTGKLHKYYYQINGKSAQENYQNQKEKIIGQYSAPHIEINTEEAQEQIQRLIQDLIDNLKIDL